MLLDRSKILVTGILAVLVLMSSGCGRTQSTLVPRVNVGQLIDGDSDAQTPQSAEQAEQYANEQIDAELRGRKSELADTSKAVLASAEKEGRSWKDRLLPKKANIPSAADFAADPFLDELDGMIAKQEEHLKETVTKASEKLSHFEAAELFGETGEMAANSMAKLDRAASETVAQTQDVFGAAADDVFGDKPPADSFSEPPPLEQASRNGAGRQSVAQRVPGGVVHRFDDLFDEAKSTASQVQRTANETRESAQSFFGTHGEPAPREPHQLNMESVRTDSPVVASGVAAPVEIPMTADVSVSQTPEAPTEITASMFEPPEVAVPEPTIPEPVDVAATLPGIPDLPEVPAMRDVPGETMAGFEQQDAVVTANQPAKLPAPAQPEFNDNDFAAMERVEVDPYGEPALGLSSAAAPPTAASGLSIPSFEPAPSFGDEEPKLPGLDQLPPVEIPQEPVPRFTAQKPSPPAIPVQRATQTTRQMPATTFAAPPEAPAVAAVLPDVSWQGQTSTPRTLRAPSEWTAWFLMGGAALIVLLLFAPGRRA